MKHVTDENWFVVGLEMVVVVLGIIIGLQFSNWNEQRLELVKGQSYLNRIADELEQDIRFFNGVLRSNERSIENAQFLLETAENEDLVREDPTRFITSIASVGASIVVNVNNNTFEEIKFSGKLEIIEDEELRAQIADYYDFIEISQTFSHMRMDAETGYQNRYVGVLTPDQYSGAGRDVSYTEVDALLVYERFMQNLPLIDWLPVMIKTKRNTISFSTRSQRRAEELLAKIRGEELPEEEPASEQPSN